MPGTRGGTGKPLWFRCSVCRKNYSWREYHGERTGRPGNLGDVVLTGKTKPINDGNSSGRNTNVLRQYKCKCGHVGFSRHVDLERAKTETE